MGQPSIQKHHFDGPVLLCTALALGPHLGGALRSVVREKSAGSSRSSRRDLRPDFRRVAPRRAATPLAPNCPKMRAIDRSRPRHFFETKRSPTFFFSAPTFFGKNLPRQLFFSRFFLRYGRGAENKNTTDSESKSKKFSRRLRRRESYVFSTYIPAFPQFSSQNAPLFSKFSPRALRARAGKKTPQTPNNIPPPPRVC